MIVSCDSFLLPYSSVEEKQPPFVDLGFVETASWHDHARDLLHMINYFRKEMPRPIVGVGHSAGGTELYELQDS
jgi:hypothetical protein